MKGIATALCAAISIDAKAIDANGAPEWLHMLPAGEARTHDGRGPYRVADVPALLAASMAAAGGRMVVCENHATDLAAPRGEAAPARGWITELQGRDDGVWGRVEWTADGRRIVEAKEYRGISPVIAHARDGTVTALLRATLTNTPNLAGLTSLHHERNDMALRESLIEALGLDGEADDAAIVAAVVANKDGATKDGIAKKGAGKLAGVALQAALAPIAKAAGVAEDADAAAVLAGVQLLAGGADDRVTALQSELTGVTTRLNAVTEAQTRDKATAFVDAAIAAGRVGVKPVRDNYIAMHMRDAAEAEKLINAMPLLIPGVSPRGGVAPEGAPDSPVLLSQKAAAYQRKLGADGVTIDFAAAVRAVSEGKTA